MNAEPVSRGSFVDIVLPEGQPVDYSAIVREAADAEESSAETRFKNEVETPLRSQAPIPQPDFHSPHLATRTGKMFAVQFAVSLNFSRGGICFHCFQRKRFANA